MVVLIAFANQETNRRAKTRNGANSSEKGGHPFFVEQVLFDEALVKGAPGNAYVTPCLVPRNAPDRHQTTPSGVLALPFPHPKRARSPVLKNSWRFQLGSDSPSRLMPFREEVLVKGSLERGTRQITLFVSS